MKILKRLTLLVAVPVICVTELAVWIASGKELGWMMEPYEEWLNQ